MLAYSRWGRTKDLYACSLIFSGHLFRFLLTKLNDLLASAVMLSMWLLQLSFWVTSLLGMGDFSQILMAGYSLNTDGRWDSSSL